MPILFVAGTLVGCTGRAGAWDLSGVIDLTGVWAEVEGEKRETLRQDYLVNLNHAFTSYVDFRAGFRYYRFDLAQILGADSYNEQLQPNAELRWQHPYFNVSASGFRREVRAFPLAGSLTTDNLAFVAETKEARYPTLRARYDWQHVYDQLDVDFRDTSNERIQLGVDWRLKQNDLEYVYTHRVTDNVISGLAGNEDRHTFRWRGDYYPGSEQRWRIGTNYRFDYSQLVDEVRSGSRLLQSIPVRLGLYAIHDVPTVGILDPVPTLSDGNTTVPATPNIDIGGSTTGVNIGADLGVQRPVAALYVWADRPSAEVLGWRVYISEDNLNWDLYDATPIYRFNSAVNRYELEFPQVEVRYIKAVKDGLNLAPTVLVTEITAFEELQQNDEVGRITRAHLADFRTDFLISRTLRTGLDATLLLNDGPGAIGDRTQVNYSLRGAWEPSEAWLHNLRWEQTLQWYQAGRPSQHDDGIFYSLLWEPWRTLYANLALNQRWNSTGGNQNAQIRSAIARMTGTPVPNINLTIEGGRNDNWDFISDRKSRTYLTRAYLNGKVLSFLDLSFNWSYQDIFVTPTSDQRYRNSYSLTFSFRATRNIYGRGSVGLVNDITSNTRQEYLLGWKLLPSLNLIGQYFLNATDDNYRSERYGVNLTWTLSTRSMAYGRYSVQDFRRAGGFLSESYELGLRIGY